MDLALRLGVDEESLRVTNNRKEISSVKKMIIGEFLVGLVLARVMGKCKTCCGEEDD